LKAILYSLLFVALAGCSQTGSSDTPAAETETATTTVSASGTTETAATTSAAPAAEQEKPMSAYENKVAELHTTAGQIDIRFMPEVAPNHVRNFIDLAEKGFYDGTKFHRVIPGFMIQGGDPNTKAGDPSTWGTGGSEKYVKAEFNATPHKRGIVSMARAQDPNSASSQFFICVADSPFLDRQYSVFGEVTKGMDVADKIVNAPKGANDRPNEPVAITKVVVRDARDDEKKQ
jgi:peptidyl-prolyl cis-trans isomerase B (cyclophilin B)